MDARLDMCHQKGFDMVELDNVDGYSNSTGFPLTAADQLYYNATLANDSHARGMSVLQKNDNEQIPKLLPYFDGALNEQCNQYKECTTAQNGDYGYDQYVAAGKAGLPGRVQRSHVVVLLQGQHEQLQRRELRHRPGRQDVSRPAAEVADREGGRRRGDTLAFPDQPCVRITRYISNLTVCCP